MVFFTHHQSNVPVLPCEDDALSEHSSDTLKRSEMGRLSQELERLDSPSPPPDEESDAFHLQGYQVRRSGRCKNVVEKSQMSEEVLECGADAKAEPSSEISAERVQVRDIQVNGEVAIAGAGASVEKDQDAESGRFKYVVDRVLGVQV